MEFLILPGLSFVVGIIVGLTGVGGASLITPMLILVFQVPASIAVSSDVVAATGMKIIGSYKHWQQQTLDRQIVTWLALGSVPGALTGVALLGWLRQNTVWDLDTILLQGLGIAISVVVSISMAQLVLLKWMPTYQIAALPKLEMATHQGRYGAIVIGAVLGCMVGLTSVSSGSMFALALMTFFRLDTQKLVGTDLTQAAILLSFTSLGHLSLGTVDWSLVIPIWIGSVPGVLVGSKLCQKVPQQVLRFIIYGLLILVSWKLAHHA